MFDEIMWAGSTISTADEWLVLYNSSYTPITLNDWKVQKFEDEKYINVVELSGVIPAQGYYLISNNSADHLFSGGESILDIDPDLIDSILSLSNSNLKLQLCHNECRADEISDVAGDGHKPLAGSNNNPKSSMKRVDYTVSGDQATAWVSNTTQLNIDSSAVDFATPKNSGRFTFALTPEVIKNVVGTTTDLNIEILGNNSWPISIQLNDSPVGEFDETHLSIPVIIESSGNQQMIISITNSDGLRIEQSIAVVGYNIGQLGINEISPKISLDNVQPWDREWVELINNDSHAINTIDWSICDQADHCQNLEDINIQPGGLLAIDINKPLSLNDQNEELSLYDPLHNLVSTIIWQKSYDHCSLISQDGSYLWTTITTLGEKNQYSACPIVKALITSTTKVDTSEPFQADIAGSVVLPAYYIKKSIIRTGYSQAWLDGISQLNKIGVDNNWYKLVKLSSRQVPQGVNNWSWLWLAGLLLILVRRGYQASVIILRL